MDTINYGFVPDERFLWHGPAAARGVVVWSHRQIADVDSRGLQPPPFVRAFNDAGFDVIRFDRAPLVDNPVRAAGWLRDELPVLRRSGYRWWWRPGSRAAPGRRCRCWTPPGWRTW